MREIKFRAWNTTIKKMGMVKTLNLVGRMSEIDFGLENPNEGWRRLARAVFGAKHSETIFMEFAGIKDKKGKDIYEGDILEWSGGEDGAYYKVVWHKERAAFLAEWITTNDEYDDLDDSFIVVGNIYENKDLLV